MYSITYISKYVYITIYLSNLSILWHKSKLFSLIIYLSIKLVFLTIYLSIYKISKCCAVYALMQSSIYLANPCILWHLWAYSYISNHLSIHQTFLSYHISINKIPVCCDVYSTIYLSNKSMYSITYISKYVYITIYLLNLSILWHKSIFIYLTIYLSIKLVYLTIYLSIP